MTRTVSILRFVLSLLVFTVCSLGAAFAQTPPNICDLIDQLGIPKQLNAHAYEILVACGRVPPPPPAPSSSAVSFSNPTNLGGVDQDVVLGGEGTYPHVTQSETQIWTEGTTSVVAYNDSRTAGSCYAGASYSTDRGATWTDMNSRPFCSGHGTNFGDPVLVYDKKHTRWLAGFLATGCGGQGMGIWSSADGINWSAGSCAHNGSDDDRESGWVDNTSTSPFYGIRNVQVTTGPDGTVFVAGMDEGGGGLSSRVNYVFRSTNGGTSWSQTQMGPSFAAPGSSTCGYFAAMFPSYWRHMVWGDIGAGPSGVIHYAYAQHGAGTDTGDIYYTRSTDDGLTWSAATRLNTDSGIRLQWQPALSVSPAGHVFVSWYDARNTTGNDYERWGRLSNDNGVTWQADDVISDASSPLPLQPDPNVQPCYAGDYDRSFADGTAFFISWVDGRTLISGNSQQDVFFDKVPDGPQPLTLTATGYRVKGTEFADLSWSPTVPGGNVNIIRDSITIATATDTGAYTDNIGAKGNNDTYVYQVCRVETGECSNLATVKFGTK